MASLRPACTTSGGVELHAPPDRRAHPGEITLIAVGELTNIAALLKSEPGIGRKIRAISLMGGVYLSRLCAGLEAGARSGTSNPMPPPRAPVFTSGVPLLIAPLDSTADLKLTPEMRVRLFARGTTTPTTRSRRSTRCGATRTTGRGDMPTLFDVLAVDLGESAQALSGSRLLNIEVAARRTRATG